jgi:hypothetical protein
VVSIFPDTLFFLPDGEPNSILFLLIPGEKRPIKDLGSKDCTTGSIFRGEEGKAIIVAKEAGVLAGLPVAEEVFAQVNRQICFLTVFQDGDMINTSNVVSIAGQEIFFYLSSSGDEEEARAEQYLCYCEAWRVAALYRLLFGVNL